MDIYRDVPCHCALGSIYQVLHAWGINVEEEIPWIRPWLMRYQMADGGLSCDNGAYLVKDEVPSSMVGTIAAFEAILLCTDREFTAEEKTFLRRGADFLIGRKLSEGSCTHHNAEERTEALGWKAPFFPRFYFYDTLRGLRALLRWSEKMKEPIPCESIAGVWRDLADTFGQAGVKNAGKQYAGARSFERTPSGEWTWGSAKVFPLLECCDQAGEVSPYLERQWKEVGDLMAANPSLQDLRGG
ncbi:MAG: hypothetical protein EOP11_16725 [Proteobacteria bacterium]|nr:MAG: hypothetical protein EOP11_16725 [Pseudomonadota bacterium]